MTAQSDGWGKRMKKIAWLDIPPLVAAAGRVRVPGSKSVSNRALLLAGLCEGMTQLRGLLDSDDTRVMLQALQQVGCDIRIENPDCLAHGIQVRGIGGQWNSAQHAELMLGNAGTAMRSLTAALALLGGHFKLDGVARMAERPIGDLVQALRQLGCRIDYLGKEGFPPLRIAPPALRAENLSRPIEVRGDVSSQFLSALLLSLPLAAIDTDVVIQVQGKLISKPYIAITLKLLSDFGVHVTHDDMQRFVIPAGSMYRTPGYYAVEGDASSASYFIAMGALAAIRETPLTVDGIGLGAIQGDIRFVEAARAMGAHVVEQENSLQISRGHWPLKAISMDCNHIPDAAMTLAVMALYARGTTRLTNIASWRVKETDRLTAMHAELTKLGAIVHTGPDFIEITPPENWRAAAITTYDDHRMAMCFSLAAFNPGKQPVRLLDPACVNKTYPGYFDDFFQVVRSPAPCIPVITIDGPTASGKGTLASELAKRLGYHYLDSGALYRVTAFAALAQGIADDDADTLAQLARHLAVQFDGGRIWYAQQEVTQAIREEAVGMMASKIAAHPPVREALVALQQSFRRAPGLLADGRDMGTVIFPDARLKVFLTASAEARAERRYKQLKEKGISAKIDDLRADLQARDVRDMTRNSAPLKPAEGAYMLDNSALSIEDSVAKVLAWWAPLQPFNK